MLFQQFWIRIFMNIFIWSQICEGVEFHPNCGFPGRPYRSKLSPNKFIYSDGDVISYTCEDYWAPPQTRKCVGGQWSGNPARCADTVGDLKVRDVACFDLTTGSLKPVLQFNNMKLHETDWKYPTAFVAKAFKDGRLIVKDDHEYLWKFNLSYASVKLYVKINFNFHNFIALPEKIRKAHKFMIEVDISPYRDCVKEYQSLNTWLKTGNRIDTYFICESKSIEHAKEELKDLPKYLNVRTRSSHNLTHEFSALFFGKIYDNNGSPLCGQPEQMIGELMKTSRENQDYVVECDINWHEENPKGIPHQQRCVGDMYWNGTRPLCYHDNSCPLEGSAFQKLLQSLHDNNETTYSSLPGRPVESSENNNKNNNDKQNNNKNSSKNTAQKPATKVDNSRIHLVVDSFTNYHHSVDGKIFAVTDSEVTYACDSEDYLLVGKDSSKCRDGKWIGPIPTCKYVSSNHQSITIILSLVGLLFILLAISGFIFYKYTKRMKARVEQVEKEGVGAMNAALGGEYNYVNKLDDGIYELYEHIAEPNMNDYSNAEYNPNGYCTQPYYDRFQTAPPPSTQLSMNDESDYVQMYRQVSADQSYEPLVTVANKPTYRPPPSPIHNDNDDDEQYMDLRKGPIHH